MKISKNFLQRVIKEELKTVLYEEIESFKKMRELDRIQQMKDYYDFFKKIFKQPLSVWVVVKDNKEIPLNWDKNNRIDDSFYGKEIGFEILSRNKKQYAFIKTFYPENFRKLYPGMID